MKQKAELITIAQYAAREQVTVAAIYKRITRGKLTPVQVGGINFIAVKQKKDEKAR